MLVISELNIVLIPKFKTWFTSSSNTSSGNLKEGIFVLISPPAFPSLSKRVHSYPIITKSLATVKEAGPPPTSATFFPLVASTLGIRFAISSL